MKWVDTRENLSITTVHSRGPAAARDLAGKKDGTITALFVTNNVDLGAYSASNGPGAPLGARPAAASPALTRFRMPFYEANLASPTRCSLGRRAEPAAWSDAPDRTADRRVRA